MNTQQNIIERLQDAANIMREHSQYNDEEHNGEGIAAQTCEDSVALMKRMLEDIKGVRALLIKTEKYLSPDDEGRESGEWIDELNETIILTEVKY
jgi:uncharacterized protein YecA (UPF0149 family)